MSKLGQMFREEREKKGLSIYEVGLSLKIHPKVLDALENGNKSLLPARSFLKGFVKSYAQHLKIDTKLALEMFADEYGGPVVQTTDFNENSTPAQATSASAASSSAANIKSRTPIESSSSSHRFFIGVGLLVGVLALSFLGRLVEKYQKEQAPASSTSPAILQASPQNPAPTPSLPANNPNPVPQNPLSSVLEQKNSSGPQMSVPQQQAGDEIKPQPSATPLLATPTPTAKPSPTPSPSATPSPMPSPQATATPTSTATPQPSPPQKSVEVIFETLSQVEIKLTGANGQTQTLKLGPDRIHTYRGKGPVQIEVSDGGAVNLIVNGRDRGVPGQVGTPIKLSY